jgi:uncharacterized membrane protein affecting hemolysin expression
VIGFLKLIVLFKLSLPLNTEQVDHLMKCLAKQVAQMALHILNNWIRHTGHSIQVTHDAEALLVV